MRTNTYSDIQRAFAPKDLISQLLRAFEALLLICLIASCQTISQPSQSAWQYTYAYLDYHQLAFFKEAAKETYSSIAVVPEYKPGLFTGQWANEIVQEVENVDKITFENVWQNRVNAYQSTFPKVQTKPLYAMLDMLEKYKLQQLIPNAQEAAISIGRALNTDLVVLVSFQGLHSSVYDPVTGNVRITHDALVDERIYRTQDSLLLSDAGISLNNAEQQPPYLNHVLKGMVLCAFENKLYDGLTELQKAVQEQPESWVPHVLIVIFAEKAGDYFLMARIAEEMIRMDDTYYAGYLAKARAEKHLKNWEDAFQYYETTAEKTKRPNILNIIFNELEDAAIQARNEEFNAKLAKMKLKYNRGK